MKTILANETCLRFDEFSYCEEVDHESLNIKYIWAFAVMVLTMLFSFLFYIYYMAKLWKLKPKMNPVTKSIARRVLQIGLILFWPFYYLWEELCSKVHIDRNQSKRQKTVENSWNELGVVKNAIENYAQMILQIILIVPYIGFLLSLPLQQILGLSLGNIFKMYSWPETYCDKNDAFIALGKLILTLFTQSLSVSSRQTTRRGQNLGQTIKNFMLSISFFFFSLARMIAVYSLISSDFPLISIPFAIVHILVVLAIQSIQLLNEIKIESQANNRTYMSTCWKFKKEFADNLLSAVTSHTLLINRKSGERGTETLKKQTLFQLLIIVENLIMLYALPHDDCYQLPASLCGWSIGFWIFGLILQVNFHTLLLKKKVKGVVEYICTYSTLFGLISSVMQPCK